MKVLKVILFILSSLSHAGYGGLNNTLQQDSRLFRSPCTWTLGYHISLCVVLWKATSIMHRPCRWLCLRGIPESDFHQSASYLSDWSLLPHRQAVGSNCFNAAIFLLEAIVMPCSVYFSKPKQTWWTKLENQPPQERICLTPPKYNDSQPN